MTTWSSAVIPKLGVMVIFKTNQLKVDKESINVLKMYVVFHYYWQNMLRIILVFVLSCNQSSSFAVLKQDSLIRRVWESLVSCFILQWFYWKILYLFGNIFGFLSHIESIREFFHFSIYMGFEFGGVFWTINKPSAYTQMGISWGQVIRNIQYLFLWLSSCTEDM